MVMIDVKKLPLDIKIGQMIMAGFTSKHYDSSLEKLITDDKIGNFILFSRNIEEKNQLTRLTEDIQKGLEINIKIPGIISVDQEGGMVTRINSGTTIFPGNMAFAAANHPHSTFRQGKIEGEELRGLGVNMNLAPVMDVNCNPSNPVIGVRSYSDSPEKVAELGLELIKGLKESKVVPVAKHFPGHGDTDVDSHLSLPVVKHSIKRLRKVELLPFKTAIENGIDAIMSAHVLFPEIEPKRLPATLSYRVLTDLLRNKMGFKGIIITDCMEMKAIAEFYGSDKAAVMAIKAGADLICISHSAAVQKACIRRIKEAVINKEISEERINESVKRILEIKEKYSISFNTVKRNYDINNSLFAEEISDKSITLLKNDKSLIPLKGRIVSISTKAVALTGAEDNMSLNNSFCHKLKENFGGSEFQIPINPHKEIIDKILEKCLDADSIVIGIYNAYNHEGQRKLVNEISKVNPNIVLVSLRNPYDFLYFKEVSAYINAYEYTNLSVKSVIKVLSGRVEAQGISPVRL
ncbi:beta-N-acetylhexosaminidase [Clostridium acetobutylicum]|uniref:beta-N-acetylhexosaminidase n=2 Tax=Clostridiaceae TaxID=31979 RepID=Q97ML4_CLOAB|nr:Beta-glucosidase homolog [Clostridium acetobutylicum ATCC 824]AEI31098.1 beta-glucosidase-like protein [Clostridium acetobutylicum DSM 1731]AWV81971.1 beta-N-acetylhexosaminidase [Clostridium acetobutylicum]PSM04258.1 beta-N-acetylhexosaminidase [Clostridium sp. NJ4]MBC2395960.1 beta-N-acetylhexosaminidase [Clostridium acetobutylicum]